MHFARLIRQFIVFCGVGSVSTIFTIVLILGLTKAGIHYILANALGYLLGLCVSFLMHRSITFRDHAKDGEIARQSVAFILVFAVGYLTQLACLYFMVHILSWNDKFSQIATMAVYVVISFTGNRLKTFAHPAERPLQ